MPEVTATGKATAPLLIKTTPDAKDYVKSGVYKVNQSFQIVDNTPQNGHYKIYYKHGLYYVDANYVNVKKIGVQKPAIEYIAKVGAASEINIYGSENTSEVVAKAKKDTVIDIIQNDNGSGFTKIWFNSKECYIETKNLTDIQSSPTANSIAGLGEPIGVIVIDSPWSAYGEMLYYSDGFEAYKRYLSGEYTDSAELMNDMNKFENSMSKCV